MSCRDDVWLEAHRHSVRCPSCNVSMNLRNTVYGVAYVCHLCGLHHGAHQATGEPLGTPASDEETRQARIDAHEALDALWRGPRARMSRDDAYARLASEIGLPLEECHIGRFTAAECRATVEICEGLQRGVLR